VPSEGPKSQDAPCKVNCNWRALQGGLQLAAEASWVGVSAAPQAAAAAAAVAAGAASAASQDTVPVIAVAATVALASAAVPAVRLPCQHPGSMELVRPLVRRPVQ